jgi:hypothetical protein
MDEVKPRVYKGIELRSTLEAKWAIFFDLIGWNWSYEPYKVIHNDQTWIPDFVLQGFDGNPIYCEVKPSNSSDEWYELDKYVGVLNLAQDSYTTLLLLGNSALNRGECSPSASIGWVVKPLTLQIESAMFFNGNSLGICDEYSSWVCKMTGEYHSQLLPVQIDIIKKHWFKASIEAKELPICGEPKYPTTVKNITN